MFVYYCTSRSSNGLQSFSGLLETFGLTSENSTDANSASNSTFYDGCTETTHLSDEQLFILVRWNDMKCVSLQPQIQYGVSVCIVESSCNLFFISTIINLRRCFVIKFCTVIWEVVINPRRACAARVTVVCLFVIHSLSVSDTTLQASVVVKTLKFRHQRSVNDTLECFDSWILKRMLRSRVMTKFVS